MQSLSKFEDVLDKDGELYFTNVGYSMYPLIKQREDILRIVKTNTFKKGDIVLYNSNQISVFYNNHNWSYTYLGHINLETKDINSLLNKDSIELKINTNLWKVKIFC